MLNKFSEDVVLNNKKRNMSSLFISVFFICLMPFVHPYLILLPFAIQIIRMLRYSHETVLADVAFLLPFSNLFRLPDGKSLLFILIMIIDIWFFCRRKMKINTGMLIIFGLLVYLLFRMGGEYIDYLAIISGIIFLYFAVDILTPSISVKISKMFVISVLLSSAFGWLFQNASQITRYLRNTDNDMHMNGVVDFRFQALFSDPNYFSVCVIIAICFLFLMYSSGEIKALRFYAGAIALFAFGIMTLSKTFFIVLVICIIAYLLMMFSKKSLYACLGFCVLIGVVLILFNSGKIEALQSIKDRFESAENLNELTTGRSDLWKIYLDKTLETSSSFLFGYGFEAPLLYNKGSHNLFLEIFYYTGSLGLIGLVGFIIWVLYTILNKCLKGAILKLKELSVFIMPLAFIVFYCSLQGMYQTIFYIEIALVAMGLMIPFTRKANNNE